MCMVMKKNMRGLTLMEVLVAVVILALGLLGLAGLQATSLRNNEGAVQRTQASYLAQDIIDRMRIDREAAVDDLSYNMALGNTPIGNTVSATELSDWLINGVRQNLPGGNAAITCNSGTDICEVTIQWDDTRGLYTGTDCGVDATSGKVDPTCFTVSTQL